MDTHIDPALLGDQLSLRYSLANDSGGVDQISSHGTGVSSGKSQDALDAVRKAINLVDRGGCLRDHVWLRGYVFDGLQPQPHASEGSAKVV